MEEEARAPTGCRGMWGPRGWGSCPWRTRVGRRPLLHCRPGLCPAWGAWGKGSVPGPPQEPLVLTTLGPTAGVRSQSQASSCASCLSCPLSALDLGGRWPASSPHPCGGRRALCLVWLRALRVCTQPRHSVHTDSCSSSSSGAVISVHLSAPLPGWPPTSLRHLPGWRSRADPSQALPCSPSRPTCCPGQAILCPLPTLRKELINSFTLRCDQ